MEKQEFLRELGTYLTILEDGEQQDILEEYSQHIDMKTEKGLSEEEVIRDFGSLKELAGQILQAYHVKPEYKKTEQEKQIPYVFKPEKDEKQGTGAVMQVFKQIWSMAKKGCRECVSCIKYIAAAFALLIVWPWKRGCLFLKKVKENHPGEIKKRRSPLGYGMKRILKSSILLLGETIYCCIRWSWNLFILLITFFSGLTALFALFFAGVLVVCLFQGYPLVGAVLICIGMLLCSGAFTGICITCLKFRKRRAKDIIRIHAEEVSHA